MEMNERVIVDKVVRKVMGSRKREWEIHRVDGNGVLLQFMYDTGVKSISLSELVKVGNTIEVRIRGDMAQLAKEGCPINLAGMVVGDTKVIVQDGKIEIWVRVGMKLIPHPQGVPCIWEDVEEAMMEAGLI